VTPAVTTPAAESRPDRRRRRSPARAVLVVVCAALLAMWVYVLFIGKQQFPNKMHDTTWPARAARVCAATAAQLEALPAPATFAHIQPKAEALRQRAEVGAAANVLLGRQLAQLEALPAPATRDDQLLIKAWFDDWTQYLRDRRAHVESWREGHDVQFAESMVGGGPVSDRMDDLADENKMVDCEVPNDFG
jgi:hypothetical protein